MGETRQRRIAPGGIHPNVSRRRSGVLAIALVRTEQGLADKALVGACSASGSVTIRYHFVCDERRQASDRSGASIPFRASMCGVVHARAGRRAPPDRHPLHARRRPHPTQRTPGSPLGGQRPPRSASRSDHPRRKQLPALRLDPRSRCARRRERGRTRRGDGQAERYGEDPADFADQPRVSFRIDPEHVHEYH